MRAILNARIESAIAVYGRAVFVLGIDRSGTSMVSEVLSRFGAYAGPAEELCKADEGNPQGYWEYKPMQAFFGDLINGVGLSIWDPAFKPAIAGRADDPEMRRRVLELAAGMRPPGEPRESAGLWLWKEQQLVFALPFLRRVFPDAFYLITLRNPYDSALSYDKLRVVPALRGKVRLIGYSLLRWQHFMVDICEGLRTHPLKLIVPYEELVSRPREQCARIVDLLAGRGGEAAASERAAERMAAAIKPRLWRNHSDVPFSQLGSVSAAQKALYAYLSSHLDGDLEDFDASAYPFPEWSREYCANMSVMQWLLGSL